LLLGVGDTAILVNRGWVYAADGLSVDSAAWREEGAASTVDGFLLPFPSATGPVDMPGRARHARRLARDSLAARFPYPIAPLLLVREERPDGEGEEQPNAAPRPARLEPPLPNTGSHRSYAIQWFAFAAIGAAGMLAVVLRSRVT
jgi:surfeit locus 1 family protein